MGVSWDIKGTMNELKFVLKEVQFGVIEVLLWWMEGGG